MKNLRRKRLVDLLNGPRFNGDRAAFLSSSGLSKGRLTQLLDPSKPFGDAAARNLCDSLGLSEGWFDAEQNSGAAAVTLPSITVEATGSPELTEQCRSIMAMLATLPDDPVIRFQVLGQLAEIVARARGSPSSHQEPPAYQSQAATRTG